jgi:hypothetical protein
MEIIVSDPRLTSGWAHSQIGVKAEIPSSRRGFVSARQMDFR